MPTFRTFPDSNFPQVKLLVIVFLTNTNAVRKRDLLVEGLTWSMHSPDNIPD